MMDRTLVTIMSFASVQANAMPLCSLSERYYLREHGNQGSHSNGSKDNRSSVTLYYHATTGKIVST